MPDFGSFSAQEPGPFHLNSAQRATARGGANEVEMTLYALENSGNDLHAISVQMIAPVARDLAHQLIAAANAADLAKHRS